MAVRSVIPVSVHSRNNRDLAPTEGQLDAVEWSQKERLRNAVKTYFLFLMINCFGAAMPPFHILMGTALFITTWVMTFEKYSQTHFIEGGSAPCPKCQEMIRIEKSKYKERITDCCAKCHEDVEILFKANPIA